MRGLRASIGAAVAATGCESAWACGGGPCGMEHDIGVTQFSSAAEMESQMNGFFTYVVAIEEPEPPFVLDFPPERSRCHCCSHICLHLST